MTADLDALFELEFDGLVRLARLISDNPSEVEDIVMDAFEQTAQRLHRLERPGAYLRTAVVNGARQRYRNRERRLAILERRQHDLTAAPLPQQPDYLGDVLAALPERQHTVIVLTYYENLSPTEIAEVLGCPAGTVRSLLHRTLRQLRAEVSA